MADVDILQGLISQVAIDLNSRFDSQDKRLDSQDRQLTEIAIETRKTNGRVTRHDGQLETLVAQDADKRLSALEAEQEAASKVAAALLAREVKEQDRAREKTSFARWLIPLLVSLAASVPIWLPFIR